MVVRTSQRSEQLRHELHELAVRWDAAMRVAQALIGASQRLVGVIREVIGRAAEQQKGKNKPGTSAGADFLITLLQQVAPEG
jgi:hypothetical protein